METNKVIEIFKSFSKLPETIQKYGVQNIVITLILSCILGLIMYLFIHPDAVIEKFNEIENQIQTEDYEKRMEIDPQVRNYLNEFRADVYADRVVVWETHNGGSNLNGLKFIYVDMTYDIFGSHVPGVAKEYTNMRTSTNQWIQFVVKKGMWYGDIDTVKDIDLAFYYRLKQAGVKRVSAFVMEGPDRPSGILSACYYEDGAGGCVYDCSRDDMVRAMTKYGTKISTLLSK